MKKNMFWIALAALIIPVLARGLWFYRGIPHQPKIATPDYQSLTVSQPPLQTPIPADDKNIKQTNGLVLFDFAHVNQYQATEIQSLKEAIGKRGGRFETITDTTSLEYKLKYASAYVVISPSVVFNSDEIRIVQAFVGRGGRLLVFTDATRGLIYYDSNSGASGIYPDANAVNPLLTPFDITINNDYLYNIKENEGNFRNVFFSGFGKNELTFGLKQVALYGTHSIKSPSGLILLRGTESTLSSINDAYDPAEGGAALSENGNVLAFGDFTFLTSPYQNAENNSTLIANIADFALGGKQNPTLANFPFIFSQPVVQVYPASEIKLTAETITSISKLQTSLRLMNMSIKIVDKAPTDGDALILGTFTPKDDLLSFIKPFDVTMEDGSEYISVPGFGNVGRYGNGLLLFEPGKKGNTLTLLSDTPENLNTLLDTISSGTLSGCVSQDKISICSVGSGGTYSDGTSTPTPGKGGATPAPTATPSG